MWIKCTDKLPIKANNFQSEEVLVVCSKSIYIAIYDYNDNCWYTDVAYLPLDDVEYWMPLPLLPQEC